MTVLHLWTWTPDSILGFLCALPIGLSVGFLFGKMKGGAR